MEILLSKTYLLESTLFANFEHYMKRKDKSTDKKVCDIKDRILILWRHELKKNLFW